MREFFDKWARRGASSSPPRRATTSSPRSSPHSRERARGRRRHRMHRLRRLLRGVRRREVESRLPRARGAQSRVDAGERRARRRPARARCDAVAGDAGCHSCHTMMSCTEHCPKQLSPTRSIAGLKRAQRWRSSLGDERVSARARGARLWVGAARDRGDPRAVRGWCTSCTIIYAVRGGLTAARGPRAHARQLRVGRFLCALRHRGGDPRRHRAAHRRRRMARAGAGARRTPTMALDRAGACGARPARGRRRWCCMMRPRRAPIRASGPSSSIACRASRWRSSCRCTSWRSGTALAGRGGARRIPALDRAARW